MVVKRQKEAPCRVKKKIFFLGGGGKGGLVCELSCSLYSTSVKLFCTMIMFRVSIVSTALECTGTIRANSNYCLETRCSTTI